MRFCKRIMGYLRLASRLGLPNMRIAPVSTFAAIAFRASNRNEE